MDGSDVAELITRYNDAWNRQDLDAVASLHHDDVVFENHTAGERAEGAAAVREHIGRIFSGNPGMTFRTRSLQTGEDFAVCEWTLSVEKDGRSLEWDGVDVFPIRDGLIARKDVYSAAHRPRER